MTLLLFIIYCNTGPCLTGNLIADWSVVIFYIKVLIHLVHITGPCLTGNLIADWSVVIFLYQGFDTFGTHHW